jgi:hypothetical protein
MREFLMSTTLIFLSMFMMGGVISFVANSTDVMQWHWTARFWLVLWGFLTLIMVLNLDKKDL